GALTRPGHPGEDGRGALPGAWTGKARFRLPGRCGRPCVPGGVSGRRPPERTTGGRTVDHRTGRPPRGARAPPAPCRTPPRGGTPRRWAATDARPIGAGPGGRGAGGAPLRERGGGERAGGSGGRITDAGRNRGPGQEAARDGRPPRPRRAREEETTAPSAAGPAGAVRVAGGARSAAGRRPGGRATLVGVGVGHGGPRPSR